MLCRWVAGLARGGVTARGECGHADRAARHPPRERARAPACNDTRLDTKHSAGLHRAQSIKDARDTPARAARELRAECSRAESGTRAPPPPSCLDTKKARMANHARRVAPCRLTIDHRARLEKHAAPDCARARLDYGCAGVVSPLVWRCRVRCAHARAPVWPRRALDCHVAP